MHPWRVLFCAFQDDNGSASCTSTFLWGVCSFFNVGQRMWLRLSVPWPFMVGRFFFPSYELIVYWFLSIDSVSLYLSYYLSSYFGVCHDKVRFAFSCCVCHLSEFFPGMFFYDCDSKCCVLSEHLVGCVWWRWIACFCLSVKALLSLCPYRAAPLVIVFCWSLFFFLPSSWLCHHILFWFAAVRLRAILFAKLRIFLSHVKKFCSVLILSFGEFGYKMPHW